MTVARGLASIAAAGALIAIVASCWDGLPAADIVRRCLSRVEPGAIYVFHVGAASEDAAGLQPIIDGLRGMGYSMAVVSDLIAP